MSLDPREREEMSMFKRYAAATTALLLTAATSAYAAPVVLQGYEAAALAEPFHLHPHFSGSSQGIYNGPAPEPVSTVTLVTNDGAAGSAQSAALLS